jgi:hypothetical protein
MEKSFNEWLKKNLGDTPGLTVITNGEAIIENPPADEQEQDEIHDHLEVANIKTCSYGNDLEGTHTLCVTFVAQDGKETAVHIEPRIAMVLVRLLLKQLDGDSVEFVDAFQGKHTFPNCSQCGKTLTDADLEAWEDYPASWMSEKEERDSEWCIECNNKL